MSWWSNVVNNSGGIQPYADRAVFFSLPRKQLCFKLTQGRYRRLACMIGNPLTKANQERQCDRISFGMLRAQTLPPQLAHFGHDLDVRSLLLVITDSFFKKMIDSNCRRRVFNTGCHVGLQHLGICYAILGLARR